MTYEEAREAYETERHHSPLWNTAVKVLREIAEKDRRRHEEAGDVYWCVVCDRDYDFPCRIGGHRGEWRQP